MKNLFMMLILALIISISGRIEASDVLNYKIDYGDSHIYSTEEMASAIALIEDEFSRWQGCELHCVRYFGDDCNSVDNVRWMNDLAKGRDIAATFDQCIAFVSDFHSPREGFGAWNLDTEYIDWQWWLARSSGGDWQLMTWGY